MLLPKLIVSNIAQEVKDYSLSILFGLNVGLCAYAVPVKFLNSKILFVVLRASFKVAGS